MQRRDFIRTAGVLGTMTAVSYRRILGANERVRIGLIGAGDRGRGLWSQFLAHADVQPVAVCDVYQPYLDEAVAMAGSGVDAHRDFRKLLDEDLDAVIIATPDHWHALPTITACEAGRDVYVEKPLSRTIREGRLMVEAARRHQRIVQTGTQQRSGAHYARAAEIVRSGKLGVVSHVSAGWVQNAMPGYSKRNGGGGPPPSGMDWDLWLGPAPYRDSLPLSPLYCFRFFWDYSGGQMTNFGAHDLDIVRWVMSARAPMEVAGVSGRFAIEDGGETPDVQEVIYRFPNFLVHWSIRETNGLIQKSRPGMFIEFHGTHGSLHLNRAGFEVVSETWPKSTDPETLHCEALTDPGSEQGEAHVRNFLDCVKSRRRPNADVEEGHLSAVMCHLGNIASRTRHVLRWDADKEECIGDSEANQRLHYEYRKPWSLS